MSFIAPTVRRSLLQPVRAYATAAAPKSSSSVVPLLLGAGAAGAGYFFYSTRGGEIEAKAKDVTKAVKGEAVSALNPAEFKNFKLKEIIEYNHDSKRYVFALPEGTDSGLTVASALVVKSAVEGGCVDDKGKPVIRPYTPTTSPGKEGELELLIKRYKGGKMSNHIDGLKIGDELAIKGPIPKIKYEPNKWESVTAIAGGSGITPIWQVFQQIDADPTDKTKATLIFSNKTEEDILLRKEFEDLAKRKPDQFKILFTLDSPPKGWTGPSGYLNIDLLKKHLPLPAFGDRVKLLVCGPPPMMNAISGNKKSPSDQGELKGFLADMGYQPSQIFKF